MTTYPPLTTEQKAYMVTQLLEIARELEVSESTVTRGLSSPKRR